MVNKAGMYRNVIIGIFNKYYQPGITEFNFLRSDIEEIADQLGIKLPGNYGDLIYSFRFRRPLPNEITDLAPDGLEWIIELAGKALYRFKLTTINRIIPNESLLAIKLPDSTPEIISKYSSGDEQALLTKVRYNRLIDIFLGITAYSLQNHLRTTVTDIGQIEIDEVYVGLNRQGVQFVVPVQAKSGNDQISIVQTKQDIAYCSEKFPELICRSVSAQFMTNDTIAIFELTLHEGEIKIVEEKHYKLVKSDEISGNDLQIYQNY